MTERGHPTAQVARKLGLTPNLLRRWKREVDSAAAFPGKGRRNSHEEELARLCQRSLENPPGTII